MRVEVRLCCAVPCDLLDDAEDPVLCGQLKEVHLFKYARHGTASEYRRWVLDHYLLIGFNAGLGQIDEANAALHHRRHAFSQTSIDQAIDQRREDIHQGGQALHRKELDLVAQVGQRVPYHYLHQNLHKLLRSKPMHLIFLGVCQLISHLHSPLVHDELISIFKALKNRRPIGLRS